MARVIAQMSGSLCTTMLAWHVLAACIGIALAHAPRPDQSTGSAMLLRRDLRNTSAHPIVGRESVATMESTRYLTHPESYVQEKATTSIATDVSACSSDRFSLGCAREYLKAVAVSEKFQTLWEQIPDCEYLTFFFHPAAKLALILTQSYANLYKADPSDLANTAMVAKSEEQTATLKKKSGLLGRRGFAAALVTVAVIIFAWRYEEAVTIHRKPIDATRAEKVDWRKLQTCRMPLHVQDAERSDVGPAASTKREEEDIELWRFWQNPTYCCLGCVCLSVQLGDTHHQSGLDPLMPESVLPWERNSYWSLILVWLISLDLSVVFSRFYPMLGTVAYLALDVLFAIWLATQRQRLRDKFCKDQKEKGKDDASKETGSAADARAKETDAMRRRLDFGIDLLAYLCCTRCASIQHARQLDGTLGLELEAFRPNAKTNTMANCWLTLMWRDEGGKLISVVGTPVQAAAAS